MGRGWLILCFFVCSFCKAVADDFLPLEIEISEEMQSNEEKKLQSCVEEAQKKMEFTGSEDLFNPKDVQEDFTMWGLNGEFDTSYQKNNDLLPVMGLLSSVQQMTQTELGILNLTKDTLLFNGKPYRCHCNHVLGELKDCCGKMAKLLGKCSSEEFELKQMRDEGRCHRISGSIKKGFLKFDKIRVFCCFPTKLLRIFHERVKEKLGLDWGTPQAPKCEGVSLEMMAKADFSDLDFSEAADAFPFDAEQAKQKMKDFLSLEHP